MKRNPFAPGVPCHRVVTSNGLGGFAGSGGAGPEVARKRRLLEAEGVRFEAGKVAADCILTTL
jgi:methylated-DNA-[protein]-cysteine S-methyltransferase